MRDLHEIIDFRAALNHRVAEGGAIDRDIGSQFHIVFDDHDRLVEEFSDAALDAGRTESVAADTVPLCTIDPRAECRQPSRTTTLG